MPAPAQGPGGAPAAGSLGGGLGLSPFRLNTPVPCGSPLDRTDIKGKIIFWSDRESTEDYTQETIYVMDADGSNQQPLGPSSKCAQETYNYYEKRLSISNEAKWFLTVERAGSGTSIFIRSDQGQLVRRVTTLDGTNYNPAWAPDQARLAFVSQVDMNDEIYISNIDGTKTRRLTFNTWEWDKHPTWSVDGKNIVFWSNREVGRMQIWMMRDDGSGQHCISNNGFNDWDPIWIYP